MNSLIECLICQSTFEEPVILPCCHTVCKKHEKENSDGVKYTISCPECFMLHEIPENGFLANLVVENLIKYKLDQLDLGPEHNAAVKSSEYLRTLIDDFKRLLKDPELEINETISKLRNKIDLHREEAKKKIDDEALELIRELDEYEARCKAGLSSDKLVVSSEIEELVKSLDRDLSEWGKELKSFERDVKALRTIHNETVNGYKKLFGDYKRLMKILFDNELKMLIDKLEEFCEEIKEEPLL